MKQSKEIETILVNIITNDRKISACADNFIANLVNNKLSETSLKAEKAFRIFRSANAFLFINAILFIL